MRFGEPGAAPRRHGASVEPASRRELERSGWRTSLEYQEIHVRGRNGRLLEAVPKWIAQAERYDGHVEFISADGMTPDEAWAALLDQLDRVPDERPRGRVRLI